MFDPKLIPAHVVSPRGVDQVNALVARLQARLTNRITMQEPGSTFRTSNVVRAYNQAQIRRCLMFLDAAWDEVIKGRGLVALTCVRAIYETVATYLGFEKQLRTSIRDGDLNAVHELMKGKTFATRIKDLIDQASPDVQATNALTQIDKMKEVRPDVREEYDHLCEFAHPNVFGAYLYFARDDREADATGFTNDSPDPDGDMKMVLVSAHLLSHLLDSLDKVEAELSVLSAMAATKPPNAKGDSGC